MLRVFVFVYTCGRFSSDMVVWLNVSEPTTSIEHNEGVYSADGKFGFIVHQITKTTVESLNDKSKDLEKLGLEIGVCMVVSCSHRVLDSAHISVLSRERV